MNDQTMLIGCIFGAVVFIAFFASRLIFGNKDEKLRSRLEKPREQGATRVVVESRGMKPLLEKLGQAAAEPFMPKTREKQSGLRKQLALAGIYSPKAVK